MRKSKFINTILFAAFSLFAVMSCDKIDAPYVIHNQPVDTSACPVPDFPAVTAHYKRALIEDYTGHDCPNCPRAAVIASDLNEHYQDSVVVISVHAGFFARVVASNPSLAYDFRSVAGTEWDAVFNISTVGNPNGMVNRRNYPASQHILSPPAWADAVKTTIAETPLMDLQLITEYNESEDKLCVHAKTTFLQTISARALNLSIVITEDSIVAIQKNSDPAVGTTPLITDYINMHVMRGAVNGNWGTPVLSKTESSGDPVIKTFPVTISTFNLNTMIPKNCHVVAFVFDAETKEVLQVAECGVIE